MSEQKSFTSPRWTGTTKLVVALTVVVIIGALLVRFHTLIGPLLMAIILAYLIHPLASWLDNRTPLPWRAVVNIIYLLLLLILLLLLLILLFFGRLLRIVVLPAAFIQQRQGLDQIAQRADEALVNFDRAAICTIHEIGEWENQVYIVMEYVEGVRVDHVDEIRSYGVDPKEIANLGFDAYMQQIFEDGFYHGDPHPGNLLVSRDGTLTFLDFGLIGVIYPERRNAFIEFLYGMVDQDPDLMVDALERMGITIAEKDRDQLREEIYVVMLDSEGESISQYSFKGMAEGLTNILRKYQIAMPQNLILGPIQPHASRHQHDGSPVRRQKGRYVAHSALVVIQVLDHVQTDDRIELH